MAVGLPVIATRSGAFPSMINLDPTRPTGSLVPLNDLDAFAHTLVEAVTSPDERGRRGDAALAYARAELTWSRRVLGSSTRSTTTRRRLRLTATGELSALPSPTHESSTLLGVVLLSADAPKMKSGADWRALNSRVASPSRWNAPLSHYSPFVSPRVAARSASRAASPSARGETAVDRGTRKPVAEP